jgi:hypothetical protein
MSADLKALLEQFGKDYRAENEGALMREIALLQKGNPDLRFDQAWSQTLIAHPELQGSRFQSQRRRKI